ncbi:MAG TPA: GntR family transcriptional regulator [Burkholderiaceae bacterium]|nr:GntR family transcriptional regulator [Burkholderiaceae bacterium]
MTSAGDAPNAGQGLNGSAGPGRRARRHGIHSDTCDRIRQMIVQGTLGSGERINEKELCEALGVSRTPIREALKVLAAEGLVELLPNRGSKVTSPTNQEIRNLFSVIAALERLAVETVTQHASDTQLAELRAMHEEMLIHFARSDRARYFALNHRIHETIIALADNAELSRTHADLMTRARRPRFIAITSNARWQESVKEHELVMSAMELRDTRYVGEILFRHVLKTGEAYIASLSPGGVGG